MVAGHVTVTRAIGSTLDRLFGHPPLREHLLDPRLAPKAIEELLRLESPAQGLFRITTREVEVGGVTLPANARVMTHFASANRDDCVFARPDDYDPRAREIGRHLAFGKGIHFCIGAPLARLELGSRAAAAAAPPAGLRRGRAGAARGGLLRARLSRAARSSGTSVTASRS